MTVGVLLVTHDHIGDAMIHATSVILGVCPLEIKTLHIPFDDVDPDQLLNEADKLVRSMDKGEGVLVLTDMFGATPSNIAHRLVGDKHVKVVTGLNLPMLMRVMNYPNLDIDELVDKAITGGREGIIINRRGP